jgi:hypothetical protein
MHSRGVVVVHAGGAAETWPHSKQSFSTPQFLVLLVWAFWTAGSRDALCNAQLSGLRVVDGKREARSQQKELKILLGVPTRYLDEAVLPDWPRGVDVQAPDIQNSRDLEVAHEKAEN